MTTEQTTPNGTPNTAPSQSLALTPQQARSIAIREEISQDATPRAIVPRTFAEAQAFASALAHSSLVPEALRERAPDLLMIVLAGAELGIAPVRSLSMFHVMDGVPKLSSEALGAIVTASPVCEYLEPRELSASRVVFAAKRKGRPEVTLAFTDEDVKAANLDRPSRSGAPSNHVKFPLDMKVARARSKICKFVFPDIAAGIVTKEEAEDLRHSRELENPPQASTFAAPLAPPTSSSGTAQASAPAAAPASSSSSSKSSTKSKAADKSKPIDTTATEGKAPASGSPAGPGPMSPTATTTGEVQRPPLGAPDPGAAAALAQAGENAREIERLQRERASEPVTDRDPVIVTPSSDNSSAAGELGPTTQDRGPEATGRDDVPPATAEDTFGGDDAPPARTIEAFESELAEVVKSKDARRLDDLKRGPWLEWSKDTSDGGGKKYAHRMRDAFARAKADMGIK